VCLSISSPHTPTPNEHVSEANDITLKNPDLIFNTTNILDRMEDVCNSLTNNTHYGDALAEKYWRMNNNHTRNVSTLFNNQ